MRALTSVGILAASALLLPQLGAAHSIDYVATSISPAATVNGGSGNFTVNGTVSPGTAITFTLTFSIHTQGETTTYPRTVTFGSTTESKPSGASDPSVALTTSQCTFANATTTCQISVTITAPSTDGAYTVKFAPTSGTGGQHGLSGGGGLAVSFTVASPSVPTIIQVPTNLAVALTDRCILFHKPSVGLTATLTTAAGPLPDMTISFSVDGGVVGSATTDGNGIATLAYNSALLSPGDHTVTASFQGLTVGNNQYLATGNSATLGVQYNFIGFQQPINADGSSLFGGRAIPVKIRIADYNAAPVVDAEAFVFFAFGTPATVGTDAEPLANTNADSGNAMRYDAAADQYIFNWDVAGLMNGTYTVRVGLGEGGCAPARTVVLSLKKKGSK